MQPKHCDHSSHCSIPRSSSRVEYPVIPSCDGAHSMCSPTTKCAVQNTRDETLKNEVTHPVILISVTEAARALGISRSHAYDLIAHRAIASVRLGRRVLVPVAEIQSIADPDKAAQLGDDAPSSRSTSRTRPSVDATGVSAACTACA